VLFSLFSESMLSALSHHTNISENEQDDFFTDDFLLFITVHL